MKQRNATIELMRFLFASSIIFFHIAGTLWDRKLILFSGEEFKLTLFRNGYIGVEFFFLVSGFLMAKSIYRRQSQACIGKLQPEPVGVETIRFLWGKVKALWPYYLPACAIGCLLFLPTKENLHPGWFVPYLPSLFFLQETGLSDASFTGLPSWYISSMLIAMAVLYPICRKFYFSFTSLFGLLLGILMTGALIQLNGNLAGTGQDWWAITFACNFRALGEIALGTVCYEASRRLSQISFSTGKRILFSLLQVAGYGLAFFYACCYTDRRFSGQVLLVLAVAITLSFSEVGYFAQRKKHAALNRFFLYLGALSLPIYLLQIFLIRLVSTYGSALRPREQCLLMYVGILAAGVVLHAIVSRLQRLTRSKHLPPSHNAA